MIIAFLILVFLIIAIFINDYIKRIKNWKKNQGNEQNK